VLAKSGELAAHAILTQNIYLVPALSAWRAAFGTPARGR
jgi:hypothetical protein